MYKNYFYLNRLTKELDQLLKDSVLISSFSQEKNILVLEFQNSSGNIYLLINTSQNDSYIQFKNDFHRAKKNVTEIFREQLPLKFIRVTIADNDRIIRFSLVNCELIFYMRGKDTNVILMDSGRIIDNFKKINDNFRSKLAEEFSKTEFNKGFNFPDFSIPGNSNFFTTVKIRYPFVSKEILNETRARISIDDPEVLKNTIEMVIKSIYFADIVVFFENNLQRIILAPEDFRIFSGSERKIFNNYLDALNYYLITRFKYDRSSNYKKLIAKNLDQQLSRISIKINEIRNKLEEPSREEQYRNFGNLLLANLYSIQKGLKEVDLYDFNGELIKLKLDEKLDAKKNAEAYFEKARNEKQSRISLAKLFRKVEDQYYKLINLKGRFEKTDQNEDYLKIMADLKIKDSQDSGQQYDDASSYRHFLIEKKYHVYVGKDSRNNDQLTTRFAKQNDYWFHARSVSGSHVVLRVDNAKEVIPKPVIKKAAAIAAFYSKAKTSKLAPVAYTLKKYVVKRKGMEPGSVNLLKENVILVEPGIPEDCEYLNE